MFVAINFYLNIQKTKVTEPQNLQKVNLQKEIIEKLKLQKIKYKETYFYRKENLQIQN